MGVQTQINRINSEVTSQASLMTQIQTALQGKAAGGGSSGGAAETCQVTVNFTGVAAGYGESGEAAIYYTNATEAVSTTAASDSTVINALKGSVLVLHLPAGMGVLGNCTTNTISLMLNVTYALVFHAPDSGTITIG